MLSALETGLELISDWSKLNLSEEKFNQLKTHRILDLKISASLVDALPLFTRNFSSSEEGHTYEEAIEVYENATLENTIKTVNEVLVSKIPYSVVDLGEDSIQNLGKINQLLEDHYHNRKV